MDWLWRTEEAFVQCGGCKEHQSNRCTRVGQHLTEPFYLLTEHSVFIHPAENAYLLDIHLKVQDEQATLRDLLVAKII